MLRENLFFIKTTRILGEAHLSRCSKDGDSSPVCSRDLSVTLELAKNADSQVPPRTESVITHRLKSGPVLVVGESVHRGAWRFESSFSFATGTFLAQFCGNRERPEFSPLLSGERRGIPAGPYLSRTKSPSPPHSFYFALMEP